MTDRPEPNERDMQTAREVCGCVRCGERTKNKPDPIPCFNADRIARALTQARAEAAPRWIPVGERLPECGPDGHSADVLVWLAEDGQQWGFPSRAWVLYDEGAPEWMLCEDFIPPDVEARITHWQPLPPPPTENER